MDGSLRCWKVGGSRVSSMPTGLIYCNYSSLVGEDL